MPCNFSLKLSRPLLEIRRPFRLRINRANYLGLKQKKNFSFEIWVVSFMMTNSMDRTFCHSSPSYAALLFVDLYWQLCAGIPLLLGAPVDSERKGACLSEQKKQIPSRKLRKEYFQWKAEFWGWHPLSDFGMILYNPVHPFLITDLIFCDKHRKFNITKERELTVLLRNQFNFPTLST